MRITPFVAPVLVTSLFALSAPLVRAADTDSVTVPIQLHGTYLYIDVRVNDKPATFVIDTGAGVNIVTPDAATRLGLVAGKDQLNAVGGGSAGVPMSQTKIDSLSIGAEQLKDQSAYILELPEALESDGLLGTPFLRNFAVTIDYEHKQLTMTLPKSFKSPKDATAFPLKFQGGTPFLEGQANGHKGWFRLDTGAGDAITLFAAFVDKQKLRNPSLVTRTMPTGRGVGGLVYGEVVRLPEFSLGKFSWYRPVAEFSAQTQGAFADPTNAGNLGGDLWHRFTLTLDYNHNKVYLQPNALFATDFKTPRSGLAIDTDNGLRTIIDVMPNSPGSDAGVMKGEILLAVNGTPVEQIKSWDLTSMFRDKPGTQLRLRLRSADKTEHEVTITLRDLL